VARLVDRMESRGILERRPDPKDRRVWRLHLKPTAEPLLAELHAARTRLARDITAALEPCAIARLEETLLAMKATLTQEPRASRRAASSAETSRPDTIAAPAREIA